MKTQNSARLTSTDRTVRTSGDSTAPVPTTDLGADSGQPRHLEPKSRKLIPLLPKPVELPERPLLRNITRPRLESRLSSQSRPRSTLSGPCGLPQCDQIPCRLISHRQRSRALTHESNDATRTAGSGRGLTLSRRRGIKPVPSEVVQPAIIKGAGFPALPWTGSPQSDPVLRRLFHDFFVKLVNRILALVVPPFPGYTEWLRGHHQELFQNGTQVQLDCINFVGAAHAYVVARSRSGPDSTFTDPVGIKIHNDLMKNVRSTLQQYDAEKDAENVLSAIFTLVLEDICTSQSPTSQSTLLAHRAAMERIVASRGGLHNMKYSIGLTCALDRLIALQIGEAPRYSTWESATLAVQRAPLYAAVYGEFFETAEDGRNIDEDVLSYCNEVNRAIEILEGEKWKFSGEARESTPEIFYLYYLRDRVETKFVFLNARSISEGTKDRCILLAAKIVQYMVLMDGYIASTTMLVSHQLRKIIQAQNIQEVWQGWENVFQWIIFVLACIPDYCAERPWAISLCLESLQRVYGLQDWPTGWEDKQLENLVRFVWSLDRLDDAFKETCVRMKDMVHHSLKGSKRSIDMVRQ